MAYSRWRLGKYEPKTAPTADPSVKDIAWAAGIFEGEGYTKATKRVGHGNSYHILVNVDQKDRWLCDKMRDFFGGSVVGRLVKANSPSDPELKREYFRWQLYGSRAVGFIQTIYVLLSPRRQAQVGLVLDAVRGN